LIYQRHLISWAESGQETNKPFPWIVSDFGLIDAIEAGLVKIPQLAVRDTDGSRGTLPTSTFGNG
jgi:hypothetical protein